MEHGEHRRLVALCQAAAPREACGLLGGVPRDGVWYLRIFPAVNVLHSRTAFRIPPAEVARTRVLLARRGMRLCGCFHSHPCGPARPSPADCRLATQVGWVWLIFSPRWNTLGAFLWRGSRFAPLDLRLY